MKTIRLFFYSVGIVLLVTATAKCISSFGHQSILQSFDPLLGFSFRNLLRAAACIETVVALACFVDKRIWLRAAMIAWLSTTFLCYRLGLWGIGWHKPCSCLGNVTDALHIPAQTADAVMKLILAYLLIGSYAIIFWLWRRKGGVATGALSTEKGITAIS